MVQFPPSFIDELNNRVQPSQIVGSRVKLKHKAGGEYLGLCPFHNEKTPSFTVSDPKGFYHCFGCGAHGNNLKFIMETEGLGFIEAVNKLADIAGMAVPKPDKETQRKYEKQLTLYDVCEEACQWFYTQLHSDSGRAAKNYLTKRGISQGAIDVFRLGFAPEDRQSLQKALLEKGFSQQQLLDTGLIIQPEDRNKKSYDRFHNRIIYPIMDYRGKVIAFGGRILGEGQPKYLNSPETDLFHKSNVLYGFDLARQAAYDAQNIIAVEGYMDVIAMYEAGIKNVVAPLGTALTQEHIQLMWKVTKEPTVCMDGDKAGKRAMLRAAHNVLPILKPGYSLKFSSLPNGEDPDDVIKNAGVTELKRIIKNAMTLSDIIWNEVLQNNKFETPEQKAAIEHRLIQLSQNIHDKTVSQYYRTFFKDKLWELQKTKNLSPEGNKSTARIATKILSTNQLHRYETMLTLAPYYHPKLLEDTDIEESYAHLNLSDSTLTEIQYAIIDMVSDEEIKNTDDLHRVIDGDILDKIKQMEKHVPIDPSIKSSSPFEIALKAWEYILSSYHSLIIDNEYNMLANDNTILSDASHERLKELKEQKDVLKKLVKTKYLSYEAALDN